MHNWYAKFVKILDACKRFLTNLMNDVYNA